AGTDTRPFSFEPDGDAPQVAAPVRLAPGFTVKGTVVDAAGRPVVGAWVQPGGTYATRMQFTKTDDAGRFTVRDLQAGIVSFSFNYGEFIADGRFLAERDPEAVTVKLRPLPKPNQPVAGANAAKDIGLKPLAVGTPAPEWMTGTWSDGQTRKLADYRGK